MVNMWSVVEHKCTVDYINKATFSSKAKINKIGPICRVMYTSLLWNRKELVVAGQATALLHFRSIL